MVGENDVEESCLYVILQLLVNLHKSARPPMEGAEQNWYRLFTRTTIFCPNRKLASRTRDARSWMLTTDMHVPVL